MWVGYRSVFGVDWKEAGHGAQIGADRMAAWLRAEGFEDPFDCVPGRYKVGGGAVLTVTEGTSPGRFKAVRYRLKEAPRAGVHWYTSLTSVSLSRRPDKELKESGYFLIEVSARAEDGVGAIDERVRTPDLTGLVLDAVTAFDGPARLTTSPQVLGVRDIDELITVLCDPGRRLPAIVAVPGEGEDLEPWRLRFTEATRYLPGIASLYLLDEEAGRKLNGDFEYHWTMAALRTFKPGVDPASREDAERHRVLKGERLEHEMDAVQAILTHRIRAEAAAAPLPRPLDDVADVLYEAGEAQRADAARLRRTFVEMGVEPARPASDGRDAHLEAEPSPFDLLADSFSDYPNLLITAEAGPMGVLDRHKDATTFAGKAREALAALDSYAAQRRSGNWEGGGFRRYCEDSRHGGRIYPATQVASLESDTVRQDPRLAEQRRFRVPRQIDPTGYAEFWAHVKIGNSGQTAPRLHYYDDTSGPTGAVVVGYIGPHLRNTRSS